MLPKDVPIEEETTHGYSFNKFYPVQIGEVFRDRYRVLAKLGFGTSSTVWLCKDSTNQSFVALKVCVHQESANQDAEVSRVISGKGFQHFGSRMIRVASDEFQVEGIAGQHQCLIFEPLALTFTEMRNRLPGRVFSKQRIQQSLCQILTGLDLLQQMGVVHTDLSPNNIMLGFEDVAVRSQIEQVEQESPSPRKVLGDRTIFTSHDVPSAPWSRTSIITDFGEARMGEPGQMHSGDVMPAVYRTPEIILGMEWDYTIDMWCFGLMIWDLFEGSRLFRTVDPSDLNDEQHLAEMVSLLGPPPQEFLQRSENCKKFWDSEGNWIASTPIPDQSLESREERLQGRDKELLLNFARKVLCWLPEDRACARDFMEPQDEFITQWLNSGEDDEV